MVSSRFAGGGILRQGCREVKGEHGAFRGTGVRSKVSPLVGAGLPGPIAVRDGGSAVVGILPFADHCITVIVNMQW